eukprot:5290979-Alexandrium_andersonii.AAC.1
MVNCPPGELTASPRTNPSCKPRRCPPTGGGARPLLAGMVAEHLLTPAWKRSAAALAGMVAERFRGLHGERTWSAWREDGCVARGQREDGNRKRTLGGPAEGRMRRCRNPSDQPA